MESSKSGSKQSMYKNFHGLEYLGHVVYQLEHGQMLGDPAGRLWALPTLQMARTAVDSRSLLAGHFVSSAAAEAPGEMPGP